MPINNNFALMMPEFEVLSLVTPTLTSENTAYPASLVTNFSNGDVVSKPSLSSAYNDGWIWDFGAAQRIDGLLLWHNADAGITLRGQHNASNVWTSPTVNVGVVAPDKHKLGFTQKLFFDFTQATGYSTGGFRYFRIYFPNNSVVPGIKALAFSQFTRLTRNAMKGYYNPQMQSSISMQTAFGNEWVYKIPAAREAVRLQFNTENASDKVAIRNWVQACGRDIACCAVNTDPTYGSPNAGMIGRIASTADSVIQAESGLTVQVFDQHIQSSDQVQMTQMSIGIRELTAGMPEWT